MTAFTRLLHLLWVAVLAAAVVLPALPGSWCFGLPARVGGWLRSVSVSQRWGMYAPNPQRSHAYMNLMAHYPGGRSEELEETARERGSWGTHWAFTKNRNDIWRFHANVDPAKPNRNRTWYLRAVCVREARRTGEVPEKVVLTQIRRRFTPPSEVARGAADLGPPVATVIQTEYCGVGVGRKMIEEDRGVPR